MLYHDWEAQSYDEKWSISFDQRCISYARDRFAAVAGTAGWPFRRALEIGAGTGTFSLNLRQAGVVDEVAVTDFSPGMVEAAQRNARGLGCTGADPLVPGPLLAADGAAPAPPVKSPVRIGPGSWLGVRTTVLRGTVLRNRVLPTAPDAPAKALRKPAKGHPKEQR